MQQFFEILDNMGLSRFLYPQGYISPNYKNEELVLNRILFAIEQRENILVYCDYDVDGLTCLLGWKDFFSHIEYPNVTYYRYSKRTHMIDQRALYQYISGGFDLLIVCDAGSNSMVDIMDLNTRGKDIVILDHHKSNYDYLEYPKNCYIINSFSDKYIMSAGALTYTVLEKLQRLLEVPEKVGLVLYALLSMYADCMDMSSDFGRGLYEKAMSVKKEDYPTLITDFKFEYSTLSRRVFEYQVAPKINAIFRAEKFDVLNDYIFNRTPLNIDFIKSKIQESWENSRSELLKISDYISVVQLRNFVIANLDTERDNIHYISPSVLNNYTGILANMLSSRYNKTTLVFCSSSPTTYKVSLRDFLSRNYLEVFKLFSNANGHNSAFGIFLPKDELNNFHYYLDILDKGEYVESVKNLPYIIDVDTPVVPATTVASIARYNEFSGNLIPQILLKKRVLKPLSRYNYNANDYRYAWGDNIIKSSSKVSIGVSLLLKPYMANKPICEVESQELL